MSTTLKAPFATALTVPEPSKIIDELDLVPLIIDRILRGDQELKDDTFRALCRTVLENGMTTRAVLSSKFDLTIPDKKPKFLNGWQIPDPDRCREILAFFLTLPRLNDSRPPSQPGQYAPPAAAPAPQG